MTNDIDTIQSRILSARSSQLKQVDSSDKKSLMEACEGFEAIFMKTMLDSMKDTLPGDALFQKSSGRELFESLYDQQLAEEISKAPSSSGLKEFLFNELKDRA